MAQVKVKIDRTKLKRVVGSDVVSKIALARECHISRPFLDRIIAGDEPAHPGVTLYINDVVLRYARTLPDSPRR